MFGLNKNYTDYVCTYVRVHTHTHTHTYTHTVKCLNHECHFLKRQITLKQDVGPNHFSVWTCNNLYVHFKLQDKYTPVISNVICGPKWYISYTFCTFVLKRKHTFKKSMKKSEEIKALLFSSFINVVIADQLSTIASQLCCAIHDHIKQLFSTTHIN